MVCRPYTSQHFQESVSLDRFRHFGAFAFESAGIHKPLWQRLRLPFIAGLWDRGIFFFYLRQNLQNACVQQCVPKPDSMLFPRFCGA